ncbi:MAG: DUF6339 family protein [Alphaproteobacteria bacterium]|nr:DUF6339 family protein [Alphaproteobacteria bacterium]
MPEILHRLTEAGYNHLLSYVADHHDVYRDPDADFGEILSGLPLDGPYMEDSGIRITRPLQPPAERTGPRHRGTMHQEDAYCLEFYSSLDGMTPQAAADPLLLTYINHFYLHRFVIRRWLPDRPPANMGLFIDNHWFGTRSENLRKRNTAGRLWWMAHISVTAAEHSGGAFSADDVAAMFVDSAEYYHRTLEFEVMMNPVLLTECVRFLLDSPERVTTGQYRAMLQYIDMECGARLLDAFGREEIRMLVRQASGNMGG